MKKQVFVPLVTALLVFAVAWFLLSFWPGMGIKLSAGPGTYFVKNLLHLAGFKLWVSGAAAALAGGIVWLAVRGGEK